MHVSKMSPFLTHVYVQNQNGLIHRGRGGRRTLLPMCTEGIDDQDGPAGSKTPVTHRLITYSGRKIPVKNYQRNFSPVLSYAHYVLVESCCYAMACRRGWLVYSLAVVAGAVTGEGDGGEAAGPGAEPAGCPPPVWRLR
jgi:hypothetical protein